MKKLLAYYENNHFNLGHGLQDKIANVTHLTDIMVSKGLKLQGQNHQIVDGYEIFEREAFYSTDDRTKVPSSAFATHVFSNSWMSEREKKRGQSVLWRKVARPLLRTLRKASLKLTGEKKTRERENKLRNKMR